ncbi:hypothetical protein JMF89_12245 [Clostridiaceae bacterium UIB06]|uniref:Uncharacterized protein n=1 Tax=Clostridium thailandense TaxID=2794346 RepID=A0A949TI39_9CLOT|nr:hypothetical protein [Clostridium thailandense]MBV7273234.1 hypothetical protein [Clostridium thailandense]MCH5137969.1 hypothetical protein [Clostridiaceae bacterium UIB06]
MSLINKLKKIAKIAVSSAEENVKNKLLESKINDINRKLENMNDKEGAHLIIKKENLEKKIKDHKTERQKKREFIKLQLKQEVKNSRLKRKEENKDLNTIKKIKKEFDELPIATFANDLAEGISELEKVKETVVKHPEDIYSWLKLAETLKFYKKTFIIINGIKAPFDLIGSTIDIGTELLGGALENAFDKDKWTLERALSQARKLGATEKQIDDFSKNYKKNMATALVKGTGHMIYKQSKKMITTGERILDFAIDKLIDNKEE